MKSYYASIDHEILLDPLRPLIPDGRVPALIYQYLRHVIYDDGLYRDVRRGICRGCPLSPLMGALYLQALDQRLAGLGLFYARFMGDWLVLGCLGCQPPPAQISLGSLPPDLHIPCPSP